MWQKFLDVPVSTKQEKNYYRQKIRFTSVAFLITGQINNMLNLYSEAIAGSCLYPECMFPEHHFPDQIALSRLIPTNSTSKGCILGLRPRGWRNTAI